MVDEDIPVAETLPPISVQWANTDYTVDDE
jgi:hypothetical protein